MLRIATSTSVMGSIELAPSVGTIVEQHRNVRACATDRRSCAQFACDLTWRPFLQPVDGRSVAQRPEPASVPSSESLGAVPRTDRAKAQQQGLLGRPRLWQFRPACGDRWPDVHRRFAPWQRVWCLRDLSWTHTLQFGGCWNVRVRRTIRAGRPPVVLRSSGHARSRGRSGHARGSRRHLICSRPWRKTRTPAQSPGTC